jgi:DNA repair exonuclease SbcCD nuclease subunit
MPDSPSFLAISDVHIGLNLYNQPELGADLRRLFAEACRMACTLQVNYLVVAGDLFDSNKPTPDLIRFVYSEIEKARLAGVRVIGIAGDHDKPVNTEAWTRISGVAAVDSIPQFAGRDYSDNPLEVMNYLQATPRRKTAEWIVLHGQVPALWNFCEERKKLDLGSLPLFELYPNLRGVLLGDIHKPYEGVLRDPATGKTAYIGYCGSLGITSSTDIGGHLGLLHFDGTQLKRVPFPLGREFIKIDLTTSEIRGFEIGYYVERFTRDKGRRPVFLVEYTASTKDRLEEIKPLYQLGYVKPNRIRNKDGTEAKQSVSIRNELNNHERIGIVLKDMVPDPQVRQMLTEALHTEDPKLVLDRFKQEFIP